MKKPPEISLKTKVSDWFSYTLARDRMQGLRDRPRIVPSQSYMNSGFEEEADSEVPFMWNDFFEDTVRDKWHELVINVPEQFDEDPT